MNPAATLGAYAGTLALVFGAAVGVGNAVGPVGTAGASPAAHGGAHGGAHDGAHGGAHGGGAPAGAVPAGAAPAPGGLAVSQDGYTLQLRRTVLPAGEPNSLQLAVLGPDGRPVTEFTREHDKELHLIVVRRDLTGYQHLHPQPDGRGGWSVPLTLAEPGPYKVYADFTPAGRADGLTLAADLTAPGAYTPAPLPPPSRTATVDGYDVQLAGDLVAGTSSGLTLTVSRDGRPVTDLQPYLAAYGHLVAIRDGDLAYLHVHPEGDVADPATQPGPDVTFAAEVPSASTYRLFLDFQHAGEVRTAAFTATAGATGSAPGAPSHSDAPHDH